MTKFLIFTLLVTLRIMYQPQAHTGPAPFASPSVLPTASAQTAQPAQWVSFQGSVNSHKVLLKWIVKENETADQFEVEKSTDGKNFIMAALVFGTDQPATANYSFYEKASTKKVLYRVKMINKNHEAVYSPVIEIDPTHPQQQQSGYTKPGSHVYYC